MTHNQTPDGSDGIRTTHQGRSSQDDIRTTAARVEPGVQERDAWMLATGIGSVSGGMVMAGMGLKMKRMEIKSAEGIEARRLAFDERQAQQQREVDERRDAHRREMADRQARHQAAMLDLERDRAATEEQKAAADQELEREKLALERERFEWEKHVHERREGLLDRAHGTDRRGRQAGADNDGDVPA